MSRQHVTPLLLPADGGAVPLAPLPLTTGSDQVSEAAIQALIQAHPSCLPIAEIDPLFGNPVPVCTELNTRAGYIDNLMITPSGLPVLVECKLWRNPEGRREVVGQILDYAKELSRWTSSDLQREVSRRLGREGNVLLEILRASGHHVDEVAFNDAVSLNLRRGRFLLLIVGDGIREGVEAITEYLQAHAGLHFTLGLVELPIYALPDGGRIVVPRVLARTVLISREVIAVPEGFAISEAVAADSDEISALSTEDTARRQFMLDLVAGLSLDDPDQMIPPVSRKGWWYLYLPAPASSCWIGVPFRPGRQGVGVRLTSNTGTIGEAAVRQSVRDWSLVAEQLGGRPLLEEMSPGRFRVEEWHALTGQPSAIEREAALTWLRERIRSYVSVFRPRIRDAVQQLREND